MMQPRRHFILLLYFLTGLSALIYQVAWVRSATLVFGVSVYAYSVTLAAFMGGMALGSLLLRRRADRLAAPLRTFGWLQGGIAFFGLLSPYLLTAILPLYAGIARSLPLDSAQVTVLRASLAILVLTPPTFLMGATLPVMARVIARRRDEIGSDIGMLYAADTLGAALGCALTGLLLLRTLGTRETIFLAAAINLIAALFAWRLSARTVDSADASAELVAPSLSGQEAHPRPTDRRYVLWGYALSGFAALGYEVVWARILAIFTLDAVFSFAIMLTTFLAGLTIGGWSASYWVRRRPVTVRTFGLLQLLLALLVLTTPFVFARLPRLSIEDLFGVYSVGNLILFEFLLGFLSLILPTIVLGMLFPVVAELYTGGLTSGVGRHIGLVNGLNTVGAILGSIVTGFLLIPALGLQHSLVLLAALNLTIGIGAVLLRPQSAMRRWGVPALALASALLLVVTLPPGQYLGFREGPSEYLVFYGEGVETTVAVFDIPKENFKVSFVNGRIEVPTDEISMRAFRLLGHLPPLLHPQARTALMLSFGNGIATGSMESHGFERIDAVDLAAEQFEAAEIYWQENHRVLNSPALHTHVEDGRNFLLQTPLIYDVITTDATHPSNTSSWALFTREFYASVDSRLAADGVFMQWIPFHSLLEDDYRAILRTFQSVFPHASLWYTGGSHTLLLATRSELDPVQLQLLLMNAADNPIVTADIGPAPALARFWAMDEEELHSYAGAGRIVTDNDAYFLPANRETDQIMQRMQRAVAGR